MLGLLIIASKLSTFRASNSTKRMLNDPTVTIGYMDTGGVSGSSLTDAISHIESNKNNKLIYIDGCQNGESLEVDIEITPHDELVQLGLLNLKRKISVTRGNFGISPDKTNGLTLKIITPGKADRVEYHYSNSGRTIDINAAYPPLVFRKEIEGLSVEFEFQNIRAGQEADAFFYKSDVPVPQYKVLNTNFDFVFKTKVAENPGDYTGEGDSYSDTFNIRYFEVKDKAAGSEDGPSAGLKSGEIAGIVIAVIVVVVAVIVGIIFALKHKNSKADESE